MKTVIALLTAIALPATAAVISYRYDAAGRLTGVNYGGASNTIYAYDNNGSLLSRVNAVAPLPPLAANYTGLIANAAPTVGDTGAISLKLLPNGAFSGKLAVAGKTFAFKGTFADDGSTPPIVLGSLTLALALDVDGGTNQITGTLTDGSFTSDVTLDRAAFDKKRNPVPGGIVGGYTALFEPTSAAATIPQGHGIATASLKNSGALRIAGTLADGTKFSAGSTLTADSSAPITAVLYRKSGILAGTFHFRRVLGIGDMDAVLAWTKPANTGALFNAPFATELDAVGSIYARPAKGQLALDLPATNGNALFTTPSFTRSVTLDPLGRLTLSAPNSEGVKLKVSTATGILSGTIVDGGKARKLGGVLLLDQNIGAGFYLNATGSVPFELSAAP